MKKLSLILLLTIITTVSCYSQTAYVYDKSSLKPIKGALLTSGSKTATTDIFGQANIDQFEGADKITITSSDYITETYSYEKLKLMGYTVHLSDKSYKTDEIVISANKFDENAKYLPRQIEVINSEEIAFANSQTTADLLQQTGTIFVQKSQLGGGSPVIRGFEANKVLIMIDGVRFNNLIFRGGHLQNVLRIDDNVLDRTEILFGSGSTVYGSDALGGVMSYYTKDPVLSMKNSMYSSGSAFYRYSSADNENTGHFSVNLASKKVGFIGSLTYSNFNALSMGTNNVKNQAWLRKFTAEHINGRDTMIPTTNYYSQDPSGYNQYDILAKFLINQDKNVNHTINFQYSNTNDIPRYDRLNTINPSTGNFTSAEWYYGPERRILGSYKLSLNSKTGFYDNSSILLAYQDVNESRNNRNFGAANLTVRSENVDVYSLNADFNKTITTKNKQNFHNLSYGVEGIYNTLTSTAERQNVNTGAVSPQSTRYPDGDNSTTSIAAYIQDNWRINNMTSSTFGLRYNYYGLSSTFVDTTFYEFAKLYPDGIDQSNGALAGNLGITFLPKDDWRIYLNGSTGFRSPDVDDLAKIFETVPRTGAAYGNVIIPNPDLGPEYT
ncbi:MAG TPA: TonB-dependent receptor, partial [Ignavibacteria bacterium]|nr:TonB-dependent receptor [Ignavibacteria bacterium]